MLNGLSTTYTTSTLANNDQVYVVVTSSNGCSATSTTTTMSVTAYPSGTFLSDDADNKICAGDTVIFTANGGTNYNFMVEGGTQQNGATNTFSTASLADGDQVTVEVTNAGCIAT